MKAKRTGFLLAAAAMVGLSTGCAMPAGTALRQRHESVREELYAEKDGESSPVAPVAPVTLDDYLRLAFARNAGLRAAFGNAQAALERIPQAKSWDDPTLSFEYFIEQMDTRYRVSLTQMFPVFGTLRMREGRAAAEAQAALHAFEAERFDLFERVARAVLEYGYLSRATDVAEENLRLLEQVEQSAEARYRSGAGAQADWTLAQIEKERLADRLASLQGQRRVQSVELAALLNLPADELLPWPQVGSSGPASIDEAALAELLAELNPELKAAESGIDAARQGRDLARRAGWPGFMLGGGWMVMPGEGGRGDESDVSLMAGISLPIWRGRIRAGVREADAMLQAAEQDRDEMRNRLRTELSMAMFQFRDAERRVELFTNSLIPKAGQVLASQQQAYAEGRADFAAWIEAQRTLLEFRLLAERAVADREIALADIGCCVGAFDLLGDSVGSLED
jgi:outer membrane protein, heavy metal efflux system